MKTIQLNNGNTIPSIGFGVFLIPNNGPTYEAVLKALKAGYRHIDTAAAYMNESDVGKAIKDSGIPREEIFITSKLWLQDYGYENAWKGIDTSLKNLGTNYIDLYLLHQPYGDVKGAWLALEEAYKQGILKNIGISNQTVEYFNQYKEFYTILPQVNQVEFNPFYQQKQLKKVMDEYGIILEAWYPLGHGNKELLKNEIIYSLSKKYNKNPGQIILRFEVQSNVVTLPKSTNDKRIQSNLDIFDFSLTEEEMKVIQTLDLGYGTHDPNNPENEKNLSSFKIHR